MQKRSFGLKIGICTILIFFIIVSFGKFTYAAEVQKDDTDEEKKGYSIVEIIDYMEKYYNNVDDNIDENEEVIDAWIEKLEDMKVDENTADQTGKIYNQLKDAVRKEKEEQSYENISEGVSEALKEGDHPIYQQPRRNTNAQNGGSASLDDMMNDADDFVNSSGGAIKYEQSALQDFSNNFYNIMLSVGVAVAVIMGGILGIKYMASSVEERATTKKTLIAYAVGCVVVFGGFAIWKLVVTILQGM